MKDKIPLNVAEDVAKEFIKKIADVCDRVEIAGSVRRRKETVGDVEICCVPKMGKARGAGLFADTELVTVNLLDERMQKLLSLSQAISPGDKAKNGRKAPFSERYYKFRYAGYPFDLFCVIAPRQWGIIYCIRTGPKEYSHWIVTHAWTKNKRCVEGELLDLKNDMARIPCPEEIDFYRALELEYVEPEKRVAPM